MLTCQISFILIQLSLIPWLQVPFPGVVKETFIALQEYLYTGVCPSLHQTDPMELIELGNRLCLPRLVALTEQYLVKELSLAAEEGEDIAEDVLYLLQPAQVYHFLFFWKIQQRVFLISYRWLPSIKCNRYEGKDVIGKSISQLPLMLLVAILANTKGCKKP